MTLASVWGQPCTCFALGRTGARSTASSPMKVHGFSLVIYASCFDEKEIRWSEADRNEGGEGGRGIIVYLGPILGSHFNDHFHRKTSVILQCLYRAQI